MSNREEQLKAFGRLLDIMDDLREKCPWDRKQTFESLRQNTIEETFELATAISRHDMTEIVCFTFQLLGSRQQAQGNAAQAYDYANPPQQAQASAPSDEDLDGLPF